MPVPPRAPPTLILHGGLERVTFGAEVWRTAGTPAGTFPLKEIHPGRFGSSPRLLAAAPGRPPSLPPSGRRRSL